MALADLTIAQKANYFGMSVKEMTAAKATYDAGGIGAQIAQTLGLDRKSCAAAWPTAIVPNLVGKARTEVAAALTAVGLVAGTATATAGTLDQVLTQTPAAGAVAKTGASVAYTYGNGS